MGKSTKRGRDETTYEEDDFVENDDGNAPKSKKTKKGPSSKSETKNWELSSGRTPRRVEVSEFKGTKLINIREFYEKDGEYLPGKKGISLTIDQYKALLRAIPEINTHLAEEGVDVKASAMSSAMSEDEAEETAKPTKRVKAKKEKPNFVATSDEEEDD